MLARIRAQCIKSLIEWWRARRPDPCLHDREWLPLAFTSSPHIQSWGSPILHPNLNPTAIMYASSSRRRPHEEIGIASNQSPLWGADVARSLVYESSAFIQSIFYILAGPGACHVPRSLLPGLRAIWSLCVISCLPDWKGLVDCGVWMPLSWSDRQVCPYYISLWKMVWPKLQHSVVLEATLNVDSWLIHSGVAKQATAVLHEIFTTLVLHAGNATLVACP